jgi:hypothetical protein
MRMHAPALQSGPSLGIHVLIAELRVCPCPTSGDHKGLQIVIVSQRPECNPGRTSEVARDAVAVVLDLVQPIVARGWVVTTKVSCALMHFGAQTLFPRGNCTTSR